MAKFYVTTPIYYVNDMPHIGHASTTIIADVIKRYKKLKGYDVFFLTGTDEHGQKIEKSATAQGLSPKQLADRVVSRYKELWKILQIDYDRFIRTTDDDHVEGVKKFFTRLREKGDIYPGEYKGHYCISDESFVSETAEDAGDGNKICPDCGKITTKVTEKCYFFRLSAYQDKLLRFYKENPEFVIPKVRMNEVISFVKAGLKDLSITRSTVKWGIPVPGDETQTIYVWLDALTNYITGINYLNEEDLYKTFWPADLHIMAKDILKFHAVYWPAFLLAAGIKPPKQEFIHGWWLQDKRKMSKSTGNVLDPDILLEHFNADAIRYFIIREAPISADGNISHEGFINRINSDLSNDWGNLVSRSAGMIQRYFNNKFKNKAEYGERETDIKKRYTELEKKVIDYYDQYLFNRGLEEILNYVNILNRYIVETEPWELAKSEDNHPKLEGILKTLVKAILSVNALLSPVIPEVARKIGVIFNQPDISLGWKDTGEIFSINKSETLFPRVDPKQFFQQNSATSDNIITIEDFNKVEMVVAKVINAQKIEKTDKLLKLEVDTGADKRTLVAGIARLYKPEDLIDKKILIVKNLKPVKLRGILSEGMILAASDADDRPFIPILPDETPIGAKLK